jgi:hypothetical protein
VPSSAAESHAVSEAARWELPSFRPSGMSSCRWGCPISSPD